MEIPYWSSTTCLSASFDETDKRWTVEVDRDGERLTLRPAHLVLATGCRASRMCRRCRDRSCSLAISIIRAITRGRIATSASGRW